MLETTAVSLGPEVAALPGTSGGVLAVLRNAVYLENTAGRIVCLVDEAGVDGPLTLRARALPAILNGLQAHPAAAFVATAPALEIERVARIHWTSAARWAPIGPVTVGAAPARRVAVDTLLTLHTAQGPAAVESPGDRGSAMLNMMAQRRLAARLAEFGPAFHARDAAAATAALAGLLGLGAGLTPAGDDVVMGLLAALVWQAALGVAPGAFVARLVSAVRAAAPERTNRISARLLWHAGAGALYAPAMALGAALLAGEPGALTAPAQRLFAIGHTSGRDLALGLGYAIQLAAAG